MRKRALAPIAVVCCLFAASCHRPYARYQPIPVESFRSTGKAKPVAVSGDSVVMEATDWTTMMSESPEPEPSKPDFYASSAVVPPAPEVHQRARPATSSASNPSGSDNYVNRVLEQPRPKPGQKKTLREVLGLKPRKKLNWWQRIPWQLKASIPVIGVAIVFAVLHISVLAIIFGLLGAFLLIRGLKKTFRVRRPWF